MNPKKLGFGLMRLPLTDPNDTTKIDYEAMSEMVDHYMDAGFNYFENTPSADKAILCLAALVVDWILIFC